MSNSDQTARPFQKIIAISALLGLFLFLLLSMNLELGDPDIWLHLKTGEYIVNHGAVTHNDPFSATLKAKPWVDHSALPQIIYYFIFRLSGTDGLIIFASFLMLAAFLLLFSCAYKPGREMYLSVIVFALAVFASRSRFNLRPENFSVLLFCAYLFILTKGKNTRFIYLLIPLQIVWVNCHGFFPLGLVLIGLTLIGEWLKLRKKLPWEWPNQEPIQGGNLNRLWIVLFLSVTACFINPNGIKGALYPLIVSLKSIHPSLINARIEELAATWKLSFGEIAAYHIFVLVSLSSFLDNYRKINLTFLLFWLFLLSASFSINRNVIYFNLAAFLACTDNLYRKQEIKKNGVLINLIKSISFILIFFSCFFFIYRMLNYRYYNFTEHRVKSRLLGLEEGFPVKASGFIYRNNLPDNLFNVFNQGSYLIYRLYPKNHVFIDGRTELYGDEPLKDYFKILYCEEESIGRLLEKYDINTVFLGGEFFYAGKLAGWLYKNPDWALVYLDEDGIIFVRKKEESDAWIKQHSVSIDKLEIKKVLLTGMGKIRINEPLGLLRLGEIFFSLDYLQKAQLQAKEALKIFPSAHAYCLLARVYMARNDLPKAKMYLDSASAIGPYKTMVLFTLSDYYLKKGETEKAAQIYKQLIALAPHNERAQYFLGMFYKNTGNLKEARKYLKKAHLLAPYSKQYRQSLLETEHALAALTN